MKKVILFLHFLAPIFFGASNVMSQNTTLKVITFNIRSVEPDFKVQPHIDYLLQEKPDLVAYQEVESRTSRMNTRDLILEIAAKTGMFTYFAKAYDKSDGFYGNAILSKYPILEASQVLLPRMQDQGGSDQRVGLISTIRVKNTDIKFINVHLDHVLADDGKKYKQLEPVLNKISSGDIVIMAGDFNAEPYGNIIPELVKTFDRQTNNDGTFSGGSAKLDYILTYPKGKFTNVSTKVDYANTLSDHHPVISTIKF